MLCTESARSCSSDESWTTDDEDTAAASGNQLWTVSFQWQDGNADGAPQTFDDFEDSADFAQKPSEGTHQQDSDDAAQPSPADPGWLQPWGGGSTQVAASLTNGQSQAGHRQEDTQQKTKTEPMSEEHKRAILGVQIASLWCIT